MPVGLFMNKIETLHTTSNNQVDQMPPVVSSSQQQTIKNQHPVDVFNFTNHHHTANVTISDDDFKYLTKFKSKSDENENSDENVDDLFLDLISGNNEADHFEQGSSLDKNMRIDTTLLSPMSIPVDQNNANTNTTTASTNNVFIQQNTVDNNLNSINNNNSTLVEFNNNNSDFNNFNGDPKNSIPNDLTSQQPTNQYESQITEEAATELLDENTNTNASHEEIEDDAAASLKTKNNIDFAIDAVLEKCRSESRNSSEDEEMYELITSKSSSKRTKKSATTTTAKPLTAVDSIPVVEMPLEYISTNETSYCSLQQQVQSADNLINSINSTSSALTQQHHQQLLQQQQCQQPMSKSSKARTSYISSLIANRQKTPTEDNCSNSQISPSSSTNQQNNTEEEKQKRISQNILTILKNNQLHNTLEANNTSTDINSNNLNSTRNRELPANNNELNKTTPDSDIQKCTKTASSKPVKSRSTKSKKSQQQQSPLTLLSAPFNPSSHEIDFVINSYNTQQQQPQPQQTEYQQQPVQLQYQQQPQHQQNDLIYLDNQNSLTFYECDNLKRLLAQPNMDSINLSNEFVNSQQQMSSVLMQTSSDRVQIEIQQIYNNSNSNIENNKDSVVEVVPAIKEPTKRKRPAKNPNAVPRAKKCKTKAAVVADTAAIPAESAVQASKNNTCSNPPDSDHNTAINNIQNCSDQQQQAAPITTTKTKKLKTIADIVKHNSEAQRNKTLLIHPQQQSQLQLQSQSQQPQQQQYQQQQQHTHQPQQIRLPHISESMFTNSDMSSINIDQLLELEFSSVNDPSSVQNQIDKYIDLDDIDLNPLDCYRNANNQATFSQNNPPLPSLTNQHDEFNFQFSVCSSSSSGFSEPSNFSSCSSQNSYNNNLNNSHVFNNSSESESSPPTTKYSNQFDMFHADGQKTNCNTMVRMNHNLNHTLGQNNSTLKLNGSNVINAQFADWNIGEFTSGVGNGSALISSNTIVGANNSNNGNASVNGINNNSNVVVGDMFGGFSFLTD